MKRPNFFILGAAKCGTSSLQNYLGEHPDICVSEPKEPFFFEAEYERGLDYYWGRYFSSWSGERAVGEARHRNLYLPYVPRRIAESVPDAKFIVAVRNPIDRAYSHWWHAYSRGLETLAFEDALEADRRRIESGLVFEGDGGPGQWARNLDFKTGMNEFRTYLDSGYYCEQIERYRQLFSAENVTTVFLEDLARDPQEVMSQLWSFLGVDPIEQGRAGDYEPSNEAKSRGYALKKRYGGTLGRLMRVSLLPGALWRWLLVEQPIRPANRKDLARHYEPHNRALERLTGRDLSHWDV